MPISSNTRKAGPFTGTGLVTTYPFNFKVFQAADVYVVRADMTGTESVLVLNTDYTVSLNADQDVSPGGNVVLSSALTSGYTLVITSSIENLQPTDLTNGGGFYPSVITDALDRACIQIQQLQEVSDRSLKIDITSSTTPANYLTEVKAARDAAQSAQAAAEAVLDSFDDRYLGAKAADPTLDNDGNALVTGALYWNTVLNNMKTWNGSAWIVWDATPPDGDKGDITVSNSGATWTVDNNVITPAKMSRTGTAGQVLTSNGAGADPSYQNIQSASHGQCRLAKSGSNLMLMPYNGNKLVINGTAQTIPSAGVSLAPPATSGTTYYIYAYMNSGTMTLEYSTTTHATDSTTGVEIKSGDATRTLVGMARTVSSAWVDTVTDRLVASWFNPLPRSLRGTSSAQQTGIVTSWVALTGCQITAVSFATAVNVCGQVSMIDANAGATGYVGIGVNGTAIYTPKTSLIGNGVVNTISTSDCISVSEGYNALQLYSGGVNASTQGAGYASITGSLEG